MDIKSIFSSKTFWGAVVSLLAQFVPHLFTILGATADAAGQASIVSWVVTVVGFILTVYGRVKANTAVTLTGSK